VNNIIRLTKPLVCILFLLPLSSLACEEITPEVAHMKIHRLGMTNDLGETRRIEVRVADDSKERSAGFQYLCAGPRVLPILFVFPEQRRVGFHMRNVQFPLDIGFFDEGGRLIETQTMVPGNKLYFPRQPFRYALEAPAGFYGDWSLTVKSSHLHIAKSPRKTGSTRTP